MSFLTLIFFTIQQQTSPAQLNYTIEYTNVPVLVFLKYLFQNRSPTTGNLTYKLLYTCTFGLKKQYLSFAFKAQYLKFMNIH